MGKVTEMPLDRLDKMFNEAPTRFYPSLDRNSEPSTTPSGKVRMASRPVNPTLGTAIRSSKRRKNRSSAGAARRNLFRPMFSEPPMLDTANELVPTTKWEREFSF